MLILIVMKVKWHEQISLIQIKSSIFLFGMILALSSKPPIYMSKCCRSGKTI